MIAARADSWETQEREPSVWLRRAGWLIAVLAICAVAADFGVWGPLREWCWQSFVVRPVEAHWGFHAEWRPNGLDRYDLTIVSVKPGGPFDRAGVQPGSIDAPDRCGWYSDSGGLYGYLAGSATEEYLVLWTDPSDPHSKTKYVVRR